MSNMIISKSIRSYIYQTGRNIYCRQLTVSTKQELEEVNRNEVADTKTPLKSWRDIPGPTSLPFIGPLHNFLPGGSLASTTTTSGKLASMLNAKQCCFDLTLLRKVQTILRGENLMPKRPTLRSIENYRTKYSDNQLKTLVNSQGMEWKNFRSQVNHMMLDPKSITAAHTKALNEVAVDIVERLRSQRNKHMMIHDINEDLKLWALEATAVVILGNRLNCFNPILHENSREKRLIALIRKLFDTIEITDLHPNIWQYLYHEYFRTVRKTLREIDRSILYYIHMARENHHPQIRKTGEEKSILEKLFDIDEITALSVGTEFIISGVDTVANAAISTLYFLGINPDKQTLLREEITSGKSRVYLRACLKESLRIISPAFANSRVTSRYYNILGYNIPPGIPIVFMHQNMSIMKSNFPQPEEYIPERWLVNKTHPLYYGNASPFATSSFGYGSRACIGRRIAELSLETLIARMVEHFDISWVGPPAVLAMSTTTYIKPPLTFVLKNIK